uniref:Uncharacterized protein ORF108_1 n=1 Tax=Nothoceros aenigmaticus TaxID=13813 RepID=C3RYN9_9EMBR|nr:hypothetical protein MeaeMp35 [Nothoceros aenigmaticus]ACC86795.1 hypothetical protein MeaeMp35 [Nothoceros aenigmaticus]
MWARRMKITTKRRSRNRMERRTQKKSRFFSIQGLSSLPVSKNVSPYGRPLPFGPRRDFSHSGIQSFVRFRPGLRYFLYKPTTFGPCLLANNQPLALGHLFLCPKVIGF